MVRHDGHLPSAVGGTADPQIVDRISCGGPPRRKRELPAAMACGSHRTRAGNGSATVAEDFGVTGGGGVGAAPLSWQACRSWSGITGSYPAPWEERLIRKV